MKNVKIKISFVISTTTNVWSSALAGMQLKLQPAAPLQRGWLL